MSGDAMRWMAARFARAGLCATLVCASSCGTRTEPVTEVVDEASYPELLARAHCERANNCCAAAGYQGPQPDCVKENAATIAEAAERARARGRFDAAAATACLAAIRSAGCFDDELFECLAPYTGSLPPGAECSDWWGECASTPTATGYCETTYASTGATTKQCMRKRSVLVGGVCGLEGLTRLECASGSYCHSRGVCVPQAREGEVCDRNIGNSCIEGLRCSDEGPPHVCGRAATPRGAPCTAHTECDSVCFGGRCLRPEALANDYWCRRR